MGNGWHLIVFEVLLAGCLVLLVAKHLTDQRRLGGETQARLWRRALAEGLVPDDADRAVWRPELVRRQRRLTGSVWARLWTWALPTAAWLSLFLMAVLESRGPVGTGLLVLLLGIGVLAALQVQRRGRRQLARLVDQL